MPVKNLLHRFQPAPLYIVLILSICYFSVQLILSHLTHALTLLMASYHMLCNIFALAGSIVTIKHNELHNEQELHHSSTLLKEDKAIADILSQKSECPNNVIQILSHDQSPESASNVYKTHNTFGWARIEILTMLIVCITLASLSFSLLVEALQTLVHIDHQDSMHLPVHVMILGIVGLLLNGFTYFIIGGYTLHQGCFLRINTDNGKVIVEPSNITIDTDTKVFTVETNFKNDQSLKKELKTELGKVHYRTRREGPAELLRDVSSTIFVIVCAVIVYFAKDKEHTAKFIDPVLSIFSCTLVVGLSYPYMKEACLILLQTIPGNIDLENFETTLVKKFPQIVSFHDLHIWQLSAQKYIATVHIIFKNSKAYAKTIDEVRLHFNDYRIANVTIQPEFCDDKANAVSVECLVQCTGPECLDKVCCKDSMTDLREISICPGGDEPTKHEHGGKKCCGGKTKTSNNHQHSHGHSHSHKRGHSHKHGHGHGKNEHRHNHSKPVAAVSEGHNNEQIENVPKEKKTVEHLHKDANNEDTAPTKIQVATSKLPEKTDDNTCSPNETNAQKLNVNNREDNRATAIVNEK